MATKILNLLWLLKKPYAYALLWSIWKVNCIHWHYVNVIIGSSAFSYLPPIWTNPKWIVGMGRSPAFHKKMMILTFSILVLDPIWIQDICTSSSSVLLLHFWTSEEWTVSPSSSLVGRKNGKGLGQQCVMVVMGCGVWCGEWTIDTNRPWTGAIIVGIILFLSWYFIKSFDVVNIIALLLCFILKP